MILDPRQAFRVGDQRHEAAGQQVENEIRKARRRHVMRRLQQKIAAPRQAGRRAAAQFGRQLGIHVRIRPGHQLQRNAMGVERLLQLLDALADAVPGVVIDAG